MNFLAHFHLAWPDEGLIAGGLEGDYYKGLLPGNLDPALGRGVKLHRAIDAHTDSHPLIVELRSHFPADIRRYAGILIDVSFDHYLTREWSRYSSLSLPDFTRVVYAALSSREAQLSPGSRLMLTRMLEFDTLNRYHDWNSVTATATRIGDRFSRGNPLLDVDRQLAPVRSRLERTFAEFYPLLLRFSERKRAHLMTQET